MPGWSISVADSDRACNRTMALASATSIRSGIVAGVIRNVRVIAVTPGAVSNHGDSRIVAAVFCLLPSTCIPAVYLRTTR